MSITVHENGGISVTGRESMALYRLIVLKHALVLYAKTGMRPSRHITPTAMLEMASEVTGKKYKRGQHAQAADDLAAVIDAAKEAR
jgi:hypothetical protein